MLMQSLMKKSLKLSHLKNNSSLIPKMLIVKKNYGPTGIYYTTFDSLGS
jgi:hypothetical protein